MQKFTRALTREIQVGNERLALTLSEEGLTIRPVGSRRPPFTISWAACLTACVQHAGEPSSEQLEHAIKTIRSGAAAAAKTPARESPETSEPRETPPASSPPPAAPAQESVSRVSPLASPASLTTLLGRIDHWLRLHRPRFHDALEPGATPSDCEHLAGELGIHLPDDLRTWLVWHNGQSADLPGALLESWSLLSVPEIIDAKKELDQMAHPGWQKHWLPFMDDDNGNYLCLDLCHNCLPVLECWRGREDHPVVFPSLQAWAEAFAADLEQGRYREDPERGTFVATGPAAQAQETS